MFKVFGSRNAKQCNGTSRRDFLKIGSLGLGSLMLPDLLRARAVNRASSKSTSVVWLWLGGGPTHVETFDPKMTAPVEYRSVTGAIKTNLPGVEIGGNFSQMAKIADKIAFFRSFAHTNSGHGGGTHWLMTGYDFPPADNGEGQNKPGMGAILSRFRGANSSTGLPTYVRMGGILGDGPSWLGTPYAPFDAQGRARQNMNLQVSLDRLGDRKNLLKDLDRVNRDLDASGTMRGLDSFETQAFDLILSRAKEVFDLKKEAPKTLDRYGRGGIGEQLLLARRLCEAGVGFVTLHHGGWDMHGDIKKSMDQLAPQIDKAIATFVEDCSARGLDEEILLVITGEFGRTPRINSSAGRDHWAPLSTLALSGGGLKMGQVIGQSNEKAEVPKSTPITPQDLMATIFHVLGLPQDLHYKDQSGRPTPMINGGKAISEVV